MIFAVSKSTDCYFNLALEEHFLRDFEDDVFMLWQNDNTIVVGKNQNTLAEINVDYVKKKGIRVVRRITGGGAVYHDMGNINFTYIVKHDGEWERNFERFAVPIINALGKIGVKAEVSGRNDIIAGGRKISGNAQTVLNGRLLHHGTLLFDVDMTVLKQALAPDKEKIQSKGIKSVASRVANLNELAGRKIDAEELIDLIHEEVKSLDDVVDYKISDADIKTAEELADKKYRTWEWNFGYSPKYTFTKSKRFPSGNIKVYLLVKDGKINEANFFGDFFGIRDVRELERALSGVNHKYDDVKKALSPFKIGEYFGGMSIDDVLEILL